MDVWVAFQAFILGVVEGLTEFFADLQHRAPDYRRRPDRLWR